MATKYKDRVAEMSDAELAKRKNNLLAFLVVLGLLMLLVLVYVIYQETTADGEGFRAWPALIPLVSIISILAANRFDYTRQEMKRRAKRG